MQPHLDEIDRLSKDVLSYLVSCQVTSLSIHGDMNALAERRAR